MGGKASSLIWCEYNPPTFSTQSKPANYLYCYKLPPPSYNYNWTDLHYAASHGNVRRIQEIIHKSGTINLNKKDYYGKTPLYWAAYKGHRACLEELLKFGASVNTKCRHGGSPLHAVVSLYPECALLLIKHGADVNLADNWGVTPMYLAATSGQIDVIRYLLASGATPDVRNKKTGEIPRQLNSHKEFCNYLSSLSKNPPSLQQLCRVNIRRRMREHPNPKIDSLAVPKKIKDFLTLAEFEVLPSKQTNHSSLNVICQT